MADAPYGAQPPYYSAPPTRDDVRPDSRADGWGTPTSVRASAPGRTGRVAGMGRGRPGRPDRGAVTPTYDPRLDIDDAHQVHHERAAERGLPAWGALLVLLGIAGIGGLIDTISGAQVRGGFNYGIVIASIVAILAVRRSGMFPVVIAPPLVYSGASAAMLYVRSSGLHDRKVLFDAAANWLVYGFPAIAAASAAVLIIAGIRMIVRR